MTCGEDLKAVAERAAAAEAAGDTQVRLSANGPGTEAIAAFIDAATPTRVLALVKALETASKKFREYEALHAAKPDMEKARRNAEMAELCERALSGEDK